ncbi:hypothetical protein L1987_37254 [Smallanthus sonchifolius]|uniref:Uncharacterized protein n=1 Tax=Smallanthus sonchifolius TaxID=185202 RepID=A0ACB9HH75_9ASTR|nr:hypothetical protein L1987_37254 [Smallanthus sonchifolius]
MVTHSSGKSRDLPRTEIVLQQRMEDTAAISSSTIESLLGEHYGGSCVDPLVGEKPGSAKNRDCVAAADGRQRQHVSMVVPTQRERRVERGENDDSA